jgi:hypothetical protein
MLKLDDFRGDTPWHADPAEFAEIAIPDQIRSVALHRLIRKQDGRGDLTVLLSQSGVPGFATPHV